MKELVRPALSIMFGVALIVFTAVGLLPVQAFASIATTAILWWFKNRDKEKADVAKAKRDNP